MKSADRSFFDRRVASPPGSDPHTAAEAFSAAVRVLRAAEYVCVLTGAGASAESGIPTFRDRQEGIWSRFSPSELATPEAWAADPHKVWEWYSMRRAVVAAAEPNAAHHALHDLVRRVGRCTVVTQNVDDLHERAGVDNVIHLHGSIMHMRCTAGCAGRMRVPDQDAASRYADSAPAPSLHVPETHHPVSIPTCFECGALMRPDVVWFGESLPEREFNRAWEAALACDVFLSVGTSNLVEPAASLPWVAATHGATVVVVNPSMEGQKQGSSILRLQGQAGSILPRLIDEAFAGRRVRRTAD